MRVVELHQRFGGSSVELSASTAIRGGSGRYVLPIKGDGALTGWAERALNAQVGNIAGEQAGKAATRGLEGGRGGAGPGRAVSGRDMADELWLLGLRVAGALHFTTLIAARLSPVHRRFAIAQNAAVGAVLLSFGYVSPVHAPALLEGGTAGRLLCAGAALWWGGRLVVLPWLNAWPEVTETWRRVGFALLHAQCAIYAVAYGWLAFGR